jgi:pyridoxine 5-phosphate synthase
MTVRLQINVDHVATIRNARGTTYPDPVTAASLCELAGADGITCHLREDRRHIVDDDVRHLKKSVLSRLNLEMAPTEEMLRIALEIKPDIVTLVPERRQERTTEGGLDVVNLQDTIAKIVKKLKSSEIAVSLFLAPDVSQIEIATVLAVDQIELHTGDYCRLQGKQQRKELARLQQAGKRIVESGISLAAGHGLTRHNVADIAAIDNLEELNIGHALIADAVFVGLDRAVRDMRRSIDVGVQRRLARNYA